MAIEPYQSHEISINIINQCGSAAALFFDVKPHSRCCFVLAQASVSAHVQ
jgi:hypothetical protein